MANDNTILFKIEVDDKGAVTTLKSTVKGYQDLNLTTHNAQKSAEKLNQTIANTGKGGTLTGVKLTEKEYQKLLKTQHQTTSAVGASTSATLELGRVLSDMPYGIRGVANNLQQLASNLFFMSKATDAATGKTIGLMGAFGNLLKGLIGPAGILIAFQGIIAAFDFFSQKTKKAEDDLSNFGGTVAKSGSNLKILRQALAEGTISTEEANKAVNKANLEYKDLNLKLDENNQLTKESIEDIDNKINALERLAKAQALQKIIEDEFAKVAQARIKLEQDTKEKLAIIGAKNEDGKLTIEAYENTTAEIKTLANGRRVVINQLTRMSLDDQIETFRDLEKTSKENIKSILTTIGDESLLDELFKGKGKDTGDVFKGKFIESYYNEIAGLEEIVKDEDFDEISDTAKITGTIILKPKIDNPDPEDLEDLTFYLDKYKQLMSGVSDFLQGETDRQLTIEQNKTNVLNKELNDRLLNENLSKDERAKIQNQIAINDEELRKKQNKIKKKAFDTQKAFNISIAVADTIAAGINASKQTYGGAFAKIAAMTAVIGAGMAQVAVIARQKFQPEAASTPMNVGAASGGAGATERAEPSFNIVGRSNDNLLINAIQAQFGKPLKAYVVSRDVTTQQQLDGMIVGQAGT
jgi:hypothetical protein